MFVVLALLVIAFCSRGEKPLFGQVDESLLGYGEEEIIVETSPTDISVESCVGPHFTLVFLQPVAVSHPYATIIFTSTNYLEKPDAYVSRQEEAENPMC